MTALRTILAAFFASALLAAAAAADAHADSFLVFKDDRPGFQAALDESAASTVIDTGGAFAADPSAATGLAFVSRSGTIAGEAWTYQIYDFDFSNAPTGSIAPGAVGGDINDTDNLNVETPASQGGATGLGTWGIDAGTGQASTRNALLLSFTTTPGGAGVGHFGVDLLDFEIPAGSGAGSVRLYDGGVLIFSQTFDWSPQPGAAQRHFIGVVAVGGLGSKFDQAVVVIGGNTDSYAADRVTFGAAIHNPEPGTVALFGLGAAGLALVVRARRRRTAAPPPEG